MSPMTKPAEAADTDFLHRWGGGDPTILYNTTGYRLSGLFFEIQTWATFPINFSWEISVAWVPYTSKILVGEKGLDFSPEIARSGRHKLMQYNRVGCLGLVYRESAKRNISHWPLVGGFPDACIATWCHRRQAGRSGGHRYFAQVGRGWPHDLIQYNSLWVKWFIFWDTDISNIPH